ncbi:hypothetical protein Emed_004606 [Eimeria media]
MAEIAATNNSPCLTSTRALRSRSCKRTPLNRSSQHEADHISTEETSAGGSSESDSSGSTSFPTTHWNSDLEAELPESPRFPFTYLRERTSRATPRPKRRTAALVALAVVSIVTLCHVQLAAISLQAKRSATGGQPLAFEPFTGESDLDGEFDFPQSYERGGNLKSVSEAQWVQRVYLLGFSLAFATGLALLRICVQSYRVGWTQPVAFSTPLQHTASQEELAELYSSSAEPLRAEEGLEGWDSLTRHAIRRSLDHFKELHTSTHQSAFSLLLHYAAQSRRRQIKYLVYRQACNALHAKVEGSLPVTKEEVTEVLDQQEELRRLYNHMLLDVEEGLDEGNLPPDLCQQEGEFLTREFRPLLLELASHTIHSLDQDRKFLKASIEMHSAAFSAPRDEQAERVSATDGETLKTVESSPQELQEDASGSAEKDSQPDLSKEKRPDLLALETRFWDARRILSTYRRDHFVPVVPDLKRCFLPELPLSVFAY